MKYQYENQRHTEQAYLSVLPKVACAAVWGCFIVFCFIYRDKITIESIVNFAPANTCLAICILLSLFALKSITVIIHSGILYAASGILFPLSTAILVNLAGSVIMTTIPFLIGKKAGTAALNRLIRKNSRLELLRGISKQNELLVSFLVRIAGLLPGDLVGIFLGASDVRYGRYIIGTMAGLFPSVLFFSIIGMSIHDTSSPAFIISAGCEIGLLALSIILYLVWRRKKKSGDGRAQ